MVIDRFIAALRANACGVHGPVTPAAAADVVADVVVEHAGGSMVALPCADPVLEGLGVPGRLQAAGARLLRPDQADWHLQLPAATVGVTAARTAVAATGSLVLTAVPGSPRAASLLPTVHVCVVRAGDVVAEIDDAIDQLASGPLPSAVIWIGGPSRTADLEMRQTLGVHGPSIVDVVVVDGAG